MLRILVFLFITIPLIILIWYDYSAPEYRHLAEFTRNYDVISCLTRWLFTLPLLICNWLLPDKLPR
jgi:hypothetical protein